MAKSTSSSKDASPSCSGFGFSPVTGIVVEIPVAIGTLAETLGFLPIIVPAILDFGKYPGNEPEPLAGGVESRELIDEVVFFAETPPECIKESGEMLLRVGDNSVGLILLSEVNELISISEKFPFKSLMVDFILDSGVLAKPEGLKAGEAKLEVTGIPRGLLSAMAMLNIIGISNYWWFIKLRKV